MTHSQSRALDEVAPIASRFQKLGRSPKDPLLVARLVGLFKKSGLSVQEFCDRTKVCTYNTLKLWTRGRTTQDKPWYELQAALTSGIGSAEPRGPNAIPVTRWQATDGSHHETAAEAERRSREHHVEATAEALSGALGVSRSRILDHAELVLALADALRVSRAAGR
jgi:hypothetical protein